MKRVKIFGAGGGGRNAVLHIQQHNIVDAEYWMLCSGFCPAEHSIINHLCLFGEQLFVEDSSSVDGEPLEKSGHFIYNLNTNENRQLIESTLNDIPDILIVVVGLSGRSGATITELVSEAAIRKEYQYYNCCNPSL